MRLAYVAGQVLLATVVGCGGEPDKQGSEVPPPPPSNVPAVSGSGYQIVQVSDGGTITGAVTVSGPVPKLPPRPLTKDPSVCGTGARESQQLTVTKAGGLKNAVVIVQNVTRGKAMPASGQMPQIDQNKCEYSPHVQIVPLNTEIAIVNSDPILHNIHFYQNDESLFNIAQPVKGQVNKHKLDKAGFVYAECDVHSWMRGHVAVVDNPYYAITDADGRFSIADLAPGNYKVKIWHEYLGEITEDVSVTGKNETALNVDMKDLLAKKNPATITSSPAAGAPPAAAAKAGTAADSKGAGNAVEVTVQMFSEGGSFRFEPPNITIKAGTTVKWVNMSDNRHSATDDPMSEKLTGQAILPSGVEPWSSPFLAEGESFVRQFTVPGKYQYFCRNHGQFGMVGTVTVAP